MITCFALPTLPVDDMTVEIWKYIPGHPDYEASNLGRVRRATASQRTPAGTIVSQNKQRYWRVGLWDGKKLHTTEVHRLACLAFRGPPPELDMHATHINGDEDDNRIENIVWKTPKGNAADKVRHGTDPSGIRNPRAKLDWPDVQQIRESESSNRVLAEEYNVAHSTIGRIKTGAIW